VCDRQHHASVRLDHVDELEREASQEYAAGAARFDGPALRAIANVLEGTLEFDGERIGNGRVAFGVALSSSVGFAKRCVVEINRPWHQ
jgi:hypothetical protein